MVSENLVATAMKQGHAYFNFQEKTEQRRILFERIDPRQEIIIFGAGEDIYPILKYVEILDWKVKVIDHRPARLEKINIENRVAIEVNGYKDILNSITFSPSAFLLIMTHNYIFDKEILSCCLDSTLPYIGLMGPKEKSKRMFSELAERGIQLESDFRARFHNPMGLDIGSETSQEVALSIIGELLAVKNARMGGMLRDANRAIHDR